jgi:hypothetical protein
MSSVMGGNFSFQNLMNSVPMQQPQQPLWNGLQGQQAGIYLHPPTGLPQAQADLSRVALTPAMIRPGRIKR